MTTPAPVTLRLNLRGLVQGVGFRQSLANRADSLGVAGWVRNRRDGSVEALLCGDPVSVNRVKEWARRGPPLARVDSVKTTAPGLLHSDPEPSIPFAIVADA